MRTLVLAVLACLIAAPAEAGKAGGTLNSVLLERYFKREDPIQVVFSDGVTGGCLPRPKAIEIAIELGLRRAGLNPDGDNLSVWSLLVQPFGAEPTYKGGGALGACTVTVTAALYWTGAVRAQTWVPDKTDGETGEFVGDDLIVLSVPAIEEVRYILANKHEMQTSIREMVSEIVDEFSNEILKAMEK